jgi:hypothetical protein
LASLRPAVARVAPGLAHLAAPEREQEGAHDQERKLVEGTGQRKEAEGGEPAQRTGDPPFAGEDARRAQGSAQL